MSVIYGVDDPEFVGKMPVRTEITVLPADTPKSPEWDDHIIVKPTGGLEINSPFLGFRVFEKIGVGIVNTRGVSSGRKSVVIGK